MQIDMNSPILKSISAVYEKREDLFKNQEQLCAVEADLSILSGFFGKDQKTTALLSVMICNEIMEDTDSIKRIMRFLGFNPLDFITINGSLAELRKAGWIMVRSRDRHFGNNTEFTVSGEVIESVTQNDPGKLIVPVPGTLPEILLAIRKIIRADRYSHSNYHNRDFLTDIERFCVCPFVENIINDTSLNEIEKFILFLFSAEFLLGQKEFDLNSILESLTCDSSETRFLLCQIKDHRSAILRDGFIRFANPGLADFSSMVLGDRILTELGDDLSSRDNSIFVSKFCQIHDPGKIREQELFFNPENQRSVDEIKDFMAPGNFSEMESRFTNKGMKPSLTMLFYGVPGTGKTELVKQIARIHGRTILQVEISQIKNKWVGESEKNLKKVFQEYLAALKHFRITPILFFNEADGILGERKQTHNSVDQMLNAMQNILLQELEDFQGIFIATTNLIANIDKAFDRRMLYKLNFQTPNEEIRLKILKNEFPDITVALLQEISGKYSLSGGQIQNIKKKFLIDNILFAETTDYSKRLLYHVEEEAQFRSRKRNIIGFKLNDLATNNDQVDWSRWKK
ncbi:MAG: ATP-binding protein [Bacteroidota bacterium]